ncbi:MAG: PQQ-binding-like beta-propeller repeat protein [Pirellulales bacterium]
MAMIAFSVLIFNVPADDAHAAGRLTTESDARRLGLKRAWFTQVRLDPARNHVERAVLVGDRLSVLTTAGVLQEINALTGETVWTAPIGNPDYPSLGPAVSERHVALLNGSTLYVLDRADGRPVIARQVGGAPGAAPALSREHAFVPLLTGRIEGYPLGEQTLTPWYYQSFGRATVAPLATPESIVWATDSGHLYVGRVGDLGVRYRLETASEFVAPPAYHKPYVYAATLSGEVFAMHESTGARRWRYSTGFPVTRAPAALKELVFVTSEEPMLHCVDALHGAALWEAPKIAQFAALSRDRVYGVDDLGGLVVLDAKTGALLGRMPTDITTNALVNDQTDRIYLISADGMVQCLHEAGAKEPLYHKPVATPEQPVTTEEAAPSSEATATESPPDTAEETAPAEEVPEETEMPAEENPFGGETEDDNPFDF